MNPDCLPKNGKVDWSRCSENTEVKAPKTFQPPSTREDFMKFVEEMAPISNGADISRLQKEISKLPN